MAKKNLFDINITEIYKYYYSRYIDLVNDMMQNPSFFLYRNNEDYFNNLTEYYDSFESLEDIDREKEIEEIPLLSSIISHMIINCERSDYLINLLERRNLCLITCSSKDQIHNIVYIFINNNKEVISVKIENKNYTAHHKKNSLRLYAKAILFNGEIDVYDTKSLSSIFLTIQCNIIKHLINLKIEHFNTPFSIYVGYLNYPENVDKLVDIIVSTYDMIKSNKQLSENDKNLTFEIFVKNMKTPFIILKYDEKNNRYTSEKNNSVKTYIEEDEYTKCFGVVVRTRLEN